LDYSGFQASCQYGNIEVGRAMAKIRYNEHTQEIGYKTTLKMYVGFEVITAAVMESLSYGI
jgi:hypothetical protein